MSLSEITKRLEKERAESETKAKSGIASLCDLLAVSGIDSVEIWFDGSGDSGSIDSISGVDAQCSQVKIPPVLNDRINDWAYSVLDGTGVDWYNNDGGFGTISIDVKDRSYTYEVNQRESTSSVAAAATVNVDTGEEVDNMSEEEDDSEV